MILLIFARKRAFVRLPPLRSWLLTCFVRIVGPLVCVPRWLPIEAGKDLSLRSKEILVMAGEMLCESARKRLQVLPVDSEHNAFFKVVFKVGGPSGPEQREPLMGVHSPEYSPRQRGSLSGKKPPV